MDVLICKSIRERVAKTTGKIQMPRFVTNQRIEYIEANYEGDRRGRCR